MSVSVSLAGLVATPGTQHLWPEKFAGLIGKLEEDEEKKEGDPSAWLVLADWLQENDEPGMEDACRWYVKHTEVYVEKDQWNSWQFRNLPKPLQAIGEPPGCAGSLAGATAKLAERIRQAREACQ